MVYFNISIAHFQVKYSYNDDSVLFYCIEVYYTFNQRVEYYGILSTKKWARSREPVPINEPIV